MRSPFFQDLDVGGDDFVGQEGQVVEVEAGGGADLD
jgi:hypothetical protein